MENKNCQVCGRPLRSKVSKALGYGPVCKKKLSGTLSITWRHATQESFIGGQSMLFESYIGGVDPVAGYQDVSVFKFEQYAGKHVVLRHALSDGEATKKGRVELEREMLLMYKGKKSGGDYFFSIDLKYHADRIISIDPIAP